MISNIIEILQKGNYYGGGDVIEIAKGKNELVTTFASAKRKIKRAWLLRKR